MKVLLQASLSISLINFRGHLINTMIELGHVISCVAPDANVDAEVRALGANLYTVPLARAGLNPVSDVLYLFNLARTMKTIMPDKVLSYTIKPVVYGSLAARLTRIKECYSMITGLGYAFMGETMKQKFAGLIAKSLYRIALRNNKKVFFQNPDDINEFIKLKIVRPAQVVLVNGSGVDLEYFACAPILSECPNFLLIARLLRDKGILEYVEAARVVKNVCPSADFTLIGPPDPSPSGLNLELIKGFVADGVIKYYGGTKDVRPYIAQKNIYVLPSYREGTPRTVLEAMAMGRPIITTDAPGCRETVIDGYNGFLVQPKSSNDLAKAMLKFIENPSLIKKMGQASRELAEKKYNVYDVNTIILSNMDLI